MKIFIFLMSFNLMALVGSGTFVPYAFNTQTDSEGSSSKFRINPYISTNHIIPISGAHHFNPEIGIAIHTDTQEEYSKQTIFINYHFSYRMNNLFLIYGLTNFITRIDGKDNGSYTDDSGGVNASPTQTSSSYTTAVNLGGEYFYRSNMSIKFNMAVTGALDSEKRKLNYLLGINYYR